MERYNYIDAVKDDLREFIDGFNTEDYNSREELSEAVYEYAINDDGVTGNASGSYFFNAWKAEEALCHNFDLLKEAFCAYGYTKEMLIEEIDNPEALDVIIRCYILDSVFEDVISEFI